MKKLISLLLICLICLNLMACEIPKLSLSKVSQESKNEIDLTAYIMDSISYWSSDIETNVRPSDYIKDLTIEYTPATDDDAARIYDEQYDVFREKCVSALTSYALALINEKFTNMGYSEDDSSVSFKDFTDEVLGMDLENFMGSDYGLGYSIPLQDEICETYGLESGAPVVEDSNVLQVERDDEYTVNLALSVDAASPVTVKGLIYAYDNNICISLRDLAAALKGTSKAFSLTVGKGSVEITKGGQYSGESSDNEGFSADEIDSLYNSSFSINNLKIDDKDKKYYSFIIKNGSSYDCFMRLIDVAMIFDLELLQSGDKSYAINTDGKFTVNLDELKSSDYFGSVSSVLVGDAITGEIFYANNERGSYPIASITKLMNYTCVMDAISEGTISSADMITISENAAKMSRSDDGVIPMSEGSKFSVSDLIYGLLLPSSNECAIALAEAVSGTESAFVERMDEKADELGLVTAEFYNCNGLPTYSDTIPATKQQNYMSAEDLFTLISYILNTYPQITDVTSQLSYQMNGADLIIKNTNPLVYNLDGVNGLKSGSTDASGVCQTATMPYTDSNGTDHYIVAIELGAESSVDRGTYIEVLTRLGMQTIDDDTGVALASERQLPQSAKELLLILSVKLTEHGLE